MPSSPAKALSRILFIPDAHAPYHDKKAFAIMLKAAKFFCPDIIVICGDFADFYSVSGHDKDPRRANDLEYEVGITRELLLSLGKLGARRKIYVCGNHEDRLERYLMQRAPALFGTVKIPEVLGLRDMGWEFVPYKRSLKLGKVNMTHDTGTAGQNAHRQAMDTFQGSAVIGHCLPIDYEVLTDKGFVKLSAVPVGAQVLAYENGRATYTPVTDKVEWDYEGEMASFDNAVIRQRMTSKHHLFTRDGRYVPVQEACETLTKDDLVRSAAPLDRPEKDVSDGWLRLVVAYAADGSQASKNSLRFHFSKQRKIERLTSLWREVGGEIGWANGEGARKKSIGLDRDTQLRLLALCPEKKLPSWLLTLSARQRRVVLDELPLWDGSTLEHENGDAGLRQFCSYKPEEVDLVQHLLMEGGIRSKRYRGNTVSWDVREEEKGADKKRLLGSFVSWAPAKERVGCISTPLKNFFIRTPCGSVELTGNTHRMEFTVRGKAEGAGQVGAMFGWLGDFDSIDYMHRMKAKREWVHGFGIGFMEPSGIVHLQPVPIVNGKCVVMGELVQ